MINRQTHRQTKYVICKCNLSFLKLYKTYLPVSPFRDTKYVDKKKILYNSASAGITKTYIQENIISKLNLFSLTTKLVSDSMMSWGATSLANSPSLPYTPQIVGTPSSWGKPSVTVPLSALEISFYVHWLRQPLMLKRKS